MTLYTDSLTNLRKKFPVAPNVIKFYKFGVFATIFLQLFRIAAHIHTDEQIKRCVFWIREASKRIKQPTSSFRKTDSKQHFLYHTGVRKDKKKILKPHGKTLRHPIPEIDF